MVEKEREVVWSAMAIEQLRSLYNYIKRDSPQNAEKFRARIFSSTLSLSKYPEKYQIDKYKTSNDGSFRAYGLYSCRVSYHVDTEKIVILRLMHVKRDQPRY